MNGRLWRYGNVQGLVRTRNDHIIFLPNPSCAQTKAFSSPPPPACCYETISQQKSAALISWLRCGEHDVTCFVRTLHQIFFHSATKLQTQSGHSVHMNVQRWIHTAILVKFNPEE